MSTAALLTKEQWQTFFLRLEGPDGCDFKLKHDDDPDSITWRCQGGWDQSLARVVLAKMGVPSDQAETVLRYCSSLGGHCDCEILFNAAQRIEKTGG